MKVYSFLAVTATAWTVSCHAAGSSTGRSLTEERCLNETKTELDTTFTSFSLAHITSPLFSDMVSELCENENEIKEAISEVSSNDATCKSFFSFGGTVSYITHACASQNCTQLAMVEWGKTIGILNDGGETDDTKLTALCNDPTTTKNGLDALPIAQCQNNKSFMQTQFEAACKPTCRALVSDAWTTAGATLGEEEWSTYPSPQEDWVSLQDKRQADVCEQREKVTDLFRNLSCYGAMQLESELNTNCRFVDCQRWLVEEWTKLGVVGLENAYTTFSTSQEESICEAAENAMEVGYGIVSSAQPKCDAYISFVQNIFSNTCVVKVPEVLVTCEACLETAEKLYAADSTNDNVDCNIVETTADGMSECVSECRKVQDGEKMVREYVARAKTVLGRDGKCDLGDLDDLAARVTPLAFSQTAIIVVSVVGVALCLFVVVAYLKWNARVQAGHEAYDSRGRNDRNQGSMVESDNFSDGDPYFNEDSSGIVTHNPRFFETESL